MHLLLLSALLWIRVSSAAFFLKDTDSVVFLGESVTAQHLYTNYVEMWALPRFPTWDLRFCIGTKYLGFRGWAYEINTIGVRTITYLLSFHG